MKGALDRARAMLARCGNPCDGLVADVLLGLQGPEVLLAEIDTHAAGSGAIAPLPGGMHRLGAGAQAPVGVASSTDALALLDAARCQDAPVVEGVARFLTSAQQPDGSWCDPTDGVRAGSADRVELTAAVCGSLARTTCVRASVLHRAGQYLSDHWSEERVRADSSCLSCRCDLPPVIRAIADESFPGGDYIACRSSSSLSMARATVGSRPQIGTPPHWADPRWGRRQRRVPRPSF